MIIVPVLHNSQSEHCVQCILYSDWIILEYESKTNARNFYDRKAM
jgi:hypothetical protein